MESWRGNHGLSLEKLFAEWKLDIDINYLLTGKK